LSHGHTVREARGAVASVSVDRWPPQLLRVAHSAVRERARLARRLGASRAVLARAAQALVDIIARVPVA
jgi:hypothetical protein